MPTSLLRPIVRGIAVGGGIAAATYAVLAGLAWRRFGTVPVVHPDQRDELLDGFIPRPDVVERHAIAVDASPAVTLDAAKQQNMFDSPIVRVIFKAREIAVGGTPVDPLPSRELLASAQALGWGVLADVPDREIVMGAVTKPWEANVVFRSLPPGAFAAFSEPGYVKIAWTLRADPAANGTSLFRTETRAQATDPVARSHFRRYWMLASPGIALIRRLLLRPLKREAERRASGAPPTRVLSARLPAAARKTTGSLRDLPRRPHARRVARSSASPTRRRCRAPADSVRPGPGRRA